ncbi:MAG: phosphatidylglycerophosphatase A [Phycisphaerales bacterium]
MTRFERLALTAGGLGLLRPAPGTWGSLPPVALAVLLVATGAPRWQVDASLVLLGVAFAVACVRFGAIAEATWGKKDPGRVVADEVAGQSIALLGLPWPSDDLPRTVAIGAIAFLAFRALDIIKPPPARGIQSVSGGLGILLDDLIAGAYACAVAQLVVRFALPAWFPAA